MKLADVISIELRKSASPAFTLLSPSFTLSPSYRGGSDASRWAVGHCRYHVLGAVQPGRLDLRA